MTKFASSDDRNFRPVLSRLNKFRFDIARKTDGLGQEQPGIRLPVHECEIYGVEVDRGL